MVAVLVTVFETAGLTGSKKQTETILPRAPNQVPWTSPLVFEAAGPRYRQTTHLSGLGGLVSAGSDSQGHMLQSTQAGVIRHGGCPVHPKRAHDTGRSDINPAVRASDVDSWPGALG